MKRIGHLHEQVCTLNNIETADALARKGKCNTYGVQRHDKNKNEENKKLAYELANLIYKTSNYSTFTIYEPKERLIYRLPYYPDRITHHAIMNICEPIWTKIFISNTYSCISGRGIHKAVKDVKKALSNIDETKYCLKLDITKFYPSIDHNILKQIIRKKIKDTKLLTILDEIIDSAPGVPIGNYLSQFFANLYLAYFDHWVKEVLKCKFYFRYADDIVILSDNKDQLRYWLSMIKVYLSQLKLNVKSNWQIFPVDSRGIDFVGYVFYHSHIKLRKSIKVRIFKLVNKYIKNKIEWDIFIKRMCSYFGWMKYCDSKHLLQKIENLTSVHYSNWNSEITIRKKFHQKYVWIVDIMHYKQKTRIDFIYKCKPYSFYTRDLRLLQYLCSVKLPIKCKIYESRIKNKWIPAA